MDDQINIVTGLTSSERKRLLHWVASLPEEDIVKVFQRGVKVAYQLKAQAPDVPGRKNKYCAFIIAARRSGWDTINGKGYRVASESQYDDFNHIRKAKAADIIRRGRTPKKRKQILAYWGEVKQLKDEGNGFRVISKYLKETRKLDVSPSYLANLWKELG